MSGTGFSLTKLGDEFERLADAELTHAELLTAAADRIAQVIPHDGCCISGADPSTLALVDTWTAGIPAQEFATAFYRAELEPTDYARHRDLVRIREHAAVLSAVTHGDLSRSPRYRQLLAPMGVEHELRLAAMDAGAPWAFVHLYRRPDKRDFNADELDGLRRAAPKLAVTLRTAVARRSQTPQALMAVASVEPVTLLVDRQLQIVGWAGPATEWLKQTCDPRRPELPMPVGALSVAIAALLGAPPQPVRIPAPSGGWWLLRAAPLEDGLHTGTVAITALPAHGALLADLRMLALGLTRGERRVCEMVLAGASTKLIAQALQLSTYTVQDRLKAVFVKAEVGSRGELVASLMA